LLHVNSMLAAPSNAEDPASRGATSSPQCMPYAQSLGTNQQPPCVTPSANGRPREMYRVHAVLENLLHMWAQRPLIRQASLDVDPHAVAPATAGSPPDSSCASRRPPTAASVEDTTPSSAGPASTEHVVSVHSSPTDSGIDSDEDFAGPVGSPIASELPIVVDNQQVPLAHHGIGLRNNIRQVKIRTDGTVTVTPHVTKTLILFIKTLING
jgi:hypothetical protein